MEASVLFFSLTGGTSNHMDFEPSTTVLSFEKQNPVLSHIPDIKVIDIPLPTWHFIA